MGTVIGIDVGGSTTKIVGLRDGRMFSPLMVKASNPKASIYGAFGEFTNENRLNLSDVSRVAVTGVGSAFLDRSIFGVPTVKIEEFQAIGRGGLYLSGLEKAVIVSMGTGTAIISAQQESCRHVGGTGVGGGTLLGLSARTLQIRDFDALMQLARDGDLSHVDLFVNDLTRDEITTLPSGTTASNFGRTDDLATPADIALGLINMVLQTIGVVAVLASRNEHTNRIVLSGTLSAMPYTTDIFSRLEPLYDVHFILPENAEFTTAVGAALCG